MAIGGGTNISYTYEDYVLHLSDLYSLAGVYQELTEQTDDDGNGTGNYSYEDYKDIVYVADRNGYTGSLPAGSISMSYNSSTYEYTVTYNKPLYYGSGTWYKINYEFLISKDIVGADIYKLNVDGTTRSVTHYQPFEIHGSSVRCYSVGRVDQAAFNISGNLRYSPIVYTTYECTTDKTSGRTDSGPLVTKFRGRFGIYKLS